MKKKIFSSIMLASLVLCFSVVLASCGGNPDLVDTSGNYSKVSTEQIDEITQTLYDEQEEGSYEFRITVKGNAEGATMDYYYNGVIDNQGNMQFDTEIKLSAAGTNLNSSMNVFYNAEDGYWYFTMEGQKVKTDYNDQFSFVQSYSIDTVTEFLSNYRSYFEGNSYLSTENGINKIKFDFDVTKSGETIGYEIYIVFDENNAFEGFSTSLSIVSVEGNASEKIEFIRSSKVVNIPSDLDSYITIW